MKKFKLTWTEIREMIIDAESKEDAMDTFNQMQSDGCLDGDCVTDHKPLIEEVQGEDSSD